MIYFDVSQRPGENEDWLLLRQGIPTSSNMDMILTPVTAKPSASQRKYICQLIGEQMSKIPPEYLEGHTSRPMQWGLDCEQEARNFYCLERSATIFNGGFCMTEDLRFGASPDFLVGLDLSAATPFERIICGRVIKGWKGATCKKAGELKCPQPGTQTGYVLDGVLPNDYRCQCHAHIVVCECEGTDFLSYSPGLPPLLIEVLPEPFTDKLRDALDGFYTNYQTALRRIRGEESLALEAPCA